MLVKLTPELKRYLGRYKSTWYCKLANPIHFSTLTITLLPCPQSSNTQHNIVTKHHVREIVCFHKCYVTADLYPTFCFILVSPMTISRMDLITFFLIFQWKNLSHLKKSFKMYSVTSFEGQGVVTDYYHQTLHGGGGLKKRHIFECPIKHITNNSIFMSNLKIQILRKFLSLFKKSLKCKLQQV